MGDWKRTVGFAAAIVAIALSLFLPWWQIGGGGNSIAIGLREVELCTAGDCTELEPGGMFGIMSTATFFYGIAAVIVLFLGGLLPSLSSEPTRPSALGAAVFYLGFAGFTMWSLPEEITVFMAPVKTPWYWCALLGPVVALVAPAVSLATRRSLGDGAPKLWRPPEVAAPAAPAPAVPAPAAPAPVPRALASAQVRDDALIAVDADGGRRQIRWEDLGGAIARELSGEASLLVDLVPRGAAPLRFVADTRITLAAGDPAADPRERLRRLIVLARTMNPGIELEAATATFVDGGEPPPAWTRDDLARYDARYRD